MDNIASACIMDTNPPAVLREANGSLCNAQTY